ncbi:AraC family transcriptional regulator [Paraburkholderia sp. MMS20-SJTR3]|uniref:AraC family transcriptional regulator n=1 Tax=Paraburkholderia sejongensis TaxID=2886946 RepID=A0ABS8JT41_9BURK|nr:AraC family transcriptional regulator [Paraburkholderia sp. MMS20-SJTR3]MCC8393012.1 AraC family transcriptional regulator [Paraburkholderia sp. MMS20-SJTR3]
MTLSTKSEALSALYRNCLFRSDNAADSHEHVARELSDHVLHWKRGVPDTALFKVQLNHLRIYALQYGAEVEVTPQPFDGFSLVHTSLRGGAQIECDGTVMSVAEGRTAVLSPQRSVRLRWSPGTQQFIVRVPDALMLEVAGRAPDDELDLVPGRLLPQSLGSQWDLITQSLLNIAAQSGSGDLRREWSDHFERNLALFLLMHQPPQAAPAPASALESAEPAHYGADTRPHNGGAKQMEVLLEYIDSRLCAPISLEDLARVAGVSFRTLNVMCRRHHGVTPMELLRNIRLEAARTRLLTESACSITDTALAFGFGHLGRFSAYYFARFNELPSDTQKRRQRCA